MRVVVELDALLDELASAKCGVDLSEARLLADLEQDCVAILRVTVRDLWMNLSALTEEQVRYSGRVLRKHTGGS